MTCVIAMREPGSDVIHMAADRAISGAGIANLGGNKLMRFPSGVLVGFAGSVSTQNVIANTPELTQVDLANNASIAVLFNRFQGVAGFPLPDAPPKAFWAEMLLAATGHLVYMGNVAGWYRVAEAVKTIGDGGPVALGSWHERADLNPQARLQRAIEVAALFMPGSVSPQSDYGRT